MATKQATEPKLKYQRKTIAAYNAVKKLAVKNGITFEEQLVLIIQEVDEYYNINKELGK